MKRTGLVLLGVLHSALLWGAAENQVPVQGGDESDSALHFWYILRRISNPKSTMLSEGGTHNSVHFSCENKGRFAHGLLNPGSEQDDIDVMIPVEEPNAILLSVAKHRFALFQSRSKALIMRKFEKGDTERYSDSVITIEGVPGFLVGEFPIVLEVLHGGKFNCRYNRAGISKSTRSMSLPIEIHTPPAPYYSPTSPRAYHSSMHGHKPLPVPPSHLPPPPAYPAPGCSDADAQHYHVPHEQNPFTK